MIREKVRAQASEEQTRSVYSPLWQDYIHGKYSKKNQQKELQNAHESGAERCDIQHYMLTCIPYISRFMGLLLPA